MSRVLNKTIQDLIIKNKTLKDQLNAKEIAVKKKNTVIQKLQLEHDFIRDRIIKLHGRAFLKDLLNTSENILGFDVINFDKTTEKSRNN